MKKTIFDDDYKVFVKRLKKARSESGLTQIQAAKKLGSTQAYISKVEDGQLRVDVTQLKRFAKVYGKSVNYFLK
ncbi:MAG: helix-turn-helix transcriptional regulator [bacterium]|nr:helix-turn-helix transcriptional regulator [bacterium]